jgi:hypothetical protein
MRNVAIPMVSKEPTRVAFRPIRSPKWPKTIEPRGRATNARPNVANDARSPMVGSSFFGKNKYGKTATAAVA